MGKRTNPFAEIGYAEYAGLHLMPFSIAGRAEKHESNRERVVASILADLHLMALCDYIKPDARLVLKGAVTQTLEGSGSDRTAAAHCVPRQLIVDTRTPQDILAHPNSGAEGMPERSFALSILFGETDILPVNFNIADSRAERYGLNDAFLRACHFIITQGHTHREKNSTAILIAVKTAFTLYKYDAETAFKRAIERLREKLQPTYIFPQDRARWSEQKQITEKYIETLQDNTTVLNLFTLHHIEGLMRVYDLL